MKIRENNEELNGMATKPRKSPCYTAEKQGNTLTTSRYPHKNAIEAPTDDL